MTPGDGDPVTLTDVEAFCQMVEDAYTYRRGDGFEDETDPGDLWLATRYADLEPVIIELLTAPARSTNARTKE